MLTQSAYKTDESIAYNAAQKMKFFIKYFFSNVTRSQETNLKSNFAKILRGFFVKNKPLIKFHETSAIV